MRSGPFPYVAVIKHLNVVISQFARAEVTIQSMQSTLYAMADQVVETSWADVRDRIISAAEQLEYVVFMVPQEQHKDEAAKIVSGMLSDVLRMTSS